MCPLSLVGSLPPRLHPSLVAFPPSANPCSTAWGCFCWSLSLKVAGAPESLLHDCFIIFEVSELHFSKIFSTGGGILRHLFLILPWSWGLLRTSYNSLSYQARLIEAQQAAAMFTHAPFHNSGSPLCCKARSRRQRAGYTDWTSLGDSPLQGIIKEPLYQTWLMESIVFLPHSPYSLSCHLIAFTLFITWDQDLLKAFCDAGAVQRWITSSQAYTYVR